MIITDAISRANSKHAVYFLLASYLEAVGSGIERRLPDRVSRLPLAGLNDLQTRYGAVAEALERETNRCNVAALREAVAVFGAALSQLRILESREGPAEDSQVRHAGLTAICS